MFDWQALAVALIVLCALAYVARRGLARLRSFRLKGRDGSPACATGCGNCGEEGEAARPAGVLVQISPKRTAKGGEARR